MTNKDYEIIMGYFNGKHIDREGLEKSCDFDNLKMTKDVTCLLYTSPSPRDRQKSRMPSSA